MIKSCVICNEEYYVNPKRSIKSKFCSNKCRVLYDVENKIRIKGRNVECFICKKLIYRNLARLENTKNHFCSHKCRAKYLTSDLNPAKIRRKRKCIICGKEYDVSNYSKQKCCSLECGYEYNRRFINITLSDELINKVTKICLSCGKSFRVWNYRNKAQFCSKNCKNEFNRIEKTCRTCGNIFIVPKYLKNRIYCSDKCSSKGIGKRKSIFFIETFERLKNKYKNIQTEELIQTDKNKYFCDILLNNNIIIECFGDYWHCNPLKFDKNYYHTKIGEYAYEIHIRDKKRIDSFIDLGYTVIVIWENNYIENLIKLEKILYEICENKKNKSGGEKRYFSFNG